MTFNEEYIHHVFILNEDLSKTLIYELPEILSNLDLEYPSFAGMRDFKHLSKVYWDDVSKTAYVSNSKPRTSTFTAFYEAYSPPKRFYEAYSPPKRFATVYEAYNSAKETGVVFHPSVMGSHEFEEEFLYDDDEMQVLYGEYVFSENGERARLGFDNISNYEELYRDHYRWLCTARRWVSDKDDFFNSWNFLNSHPALWKKEESFSAKSVDYLTKSAAHPIFQRPWQTTPNDWKRTHLTDGIVSHLECSTTRKISLKMALAGESFKFHYVADNYEEGVVALANMLHKDYSVNGERRINW